MPLPLFTPSLIDAIAPLMPIFRHYADISRR